MNINTTLSSALKTVNTALSATNEVAKLIEGTASIGNTYIDAQKEFVNLKVQKKNKIKIAQLDKQLAKYQKELEQQWEIETE